MSERDELAEALYADPELGPGYMLHDDCDHLAQRVLASNWFVKHDRQVRREALQWAADTLGVYIGDDDTEWWDGYRAGQRRQLSVLRDQIEEAGDE